MSLGIAQFDPFTPITLDALMAESDTNPYEVNVGARPRAR